MRAGTALLLTTLLVQTPPPSTSELPPDLAAAAASYGSAVDEAAELLLMSMETVIETTQKRGGSPAERLARVQELEAQKERFASEGVVPESPLLTRAATRYTKSVEQAADKLSRAFEPVVKECIRGGDPARAAELNRQLKALVFGEGSQLVGTWVRSDGLVQDGWTERFHVAKTHGHWAVHRVFTDDRGRDVSDSFGVAVEYREGRLGWSEQYRTKVGQRWENGYTWVLQPVDDSETELSILSVSPRNERKTFRLTPATPSTDRGR